jgi:hypothetical protein
VLDVVKLGAFVRHQETRQHCIHESVAGVCQRLDLFAYSREVPAFTDLLLDRHPI